MMENCACLKAPSRLVFGTGGRFGRLSPSLAQRLVDNAVELGISSFDTGLFYCSGRSQKLLFSALRKHIELSPSSFHISTKFPPGHPFDVMNAWLNSSLHQLAVRNYIDTLFVWGPSLQDINDPSLVSSFATLLSSGRIRSLGVNTHSLEVMLSLPGSLLGSICKSVMIDLSLLQQDRLPLLVAFANADIDVWAGTALCQGFLAQSLLEMTIRTRSLSYLARALFNKPTKILLSMASKVRPILQREYPHCFKSIPLSFVLSQDYVAKVPIGMLSRRSMEENIRNESSPVDPAILNHAAMLCRLY